MSPVQSSTIHSNVNHTSVSILQTTWEGKKHLQLNLICSNGLSMGSYTIFKCHGYDRLYKCQGIDWAFLGNC